MSFISFGTAIDELTTMIETVCPTLSLLVMNRPFISFVLVHCHVWLTPSSFPFCVRTAFGTQRKKFRYQFVNRLIMIINKLAHMFQATSLYRPGRRASLSRHGSSQEDHSIFNTTTLPIPCKFKKISCCFLSSHLPSRFSVHLLQEERKLHGILNRTELQVSDLMFFNTFGRDMVCMCVCCG